MKIPLDLGLFQFNWKSKLYLKTYRKVYKRIGEIPNMEEFDPLTPMTFLCMIDYVIVTKDNLGLHVQNISNLYKDLRISVTILPLELQYKSRTSCSPAWA